MAVIEGVAKKLKYNNTSVHPDVKLFIASFDDEEKKDDKKDDKSNSDGKSSKHKDVENKLAKAYILPFDYYKDVEKSTEDEDNNEGNETGGESSSSDDTGET